MIYLLIFILIIFLILFILIWIRKTLWDAIHRNLLDFEDNYKGQVARKNIFNRPVFSGYIDDIVTSISFSSAREQNKRVNYINVSLEINCPYSFSISRRDWLKAQDAGPMKDYINIVNNKKTVFILRPVSLQKVKNIASDTEIKNLLEICDDMSYVYFGATGILFEQSSAELLKDTEYKILNNKIKSIIKLGRKINGNHNFKKL